MLSRIALAYQNIQDLLNGLETGHSWLVNEKRGTAKEHK